MKKTLLTVFAACLVLQFSNAQTMDVGSPSTNLASFTAEQSLLPVSGTVNFEDLNNITGNFKLEISGTKTGVSPVYLGGVGGWFTVKADNTSTSGNDRNTLNLDETLSFTVSDIHITPNTPGYMADLVIKSIKVSQMFHQSTVQTIEVWLNGTLYQSFTDNTGLNSVQDLTFHTPISLVDGTKITFVNPGTEAPQGFRVWGFAIEDQNDTGTLPVNLTSFHASVLNNGVLLRWTTASEQNNKEFELLRSSDGKDFQLIKTIAGAGTSNKLINYNFEDKHPLSGQNYYQLKQIDRNGESSLSKIAAVSFSFKDEPFTIARSSTNELIATLHAGQASHASVLITDINGRKLSNDQIWLENGINTFTINMPQHAAGLYIINIETDKNSYRCKFLL